jgi:hypothetical protein
VKGSRAGHGSVRGVARHGVAAVIVASLVSCASASSPHAAPRHVTPTDLGGSAGVGPRVVDAATSTATAPDRAVTIDDVSTRIGAEPGTTEIAVTFAITAKGDTTIANRASFFQLVGRTGDVFAPRNAEDDPFFADIAAHTSRQGVLRFEMPHAAATGLQLLYRPEHPSDAVVIPLGNR